MDVGTETSNQPNKKSNEINSKTKAPNRPTEELEIWNDQILTLKEVKSDGTD
jgi:hypothetical protein